GQRGDIHVIFEVAEDPRFERDGEDLYTEALVTYPQLVLGADIVVPLVSGEMMLRIPASTQSGQVFHLRGRGLPQVNGGQTGDLRVRCVGSAGNRGRADDERAGREDGGCAEGGDSERVIGRVGGHHATS